MNASAEQYDLDFSRLLNAQEQLEFTYKNTPEDFIVIEQLGFEPSGEGEHLFLYIEKTNLNTEQVAGFLARKLDLSRRDIAYSGLKDKFALTQQWFSIPWPIKKVLPELSDLHEENWKVIKLSRHTRKLKRGVHQSNVFELKLKFDQSLNATQQNDFETQLKFLGSKGFPNYFGEQRFGHHGSNLSKARAYFNGELKLKKPQRGFVFSAARSYLFNHYLSARIKETQLDELYNGDLFQIDGSQSYFSEALNDDIQQRFETGLLNPMGLLLGQDNREQADFIASEAGQFWNIPENCIDWPQALAKAGLKAQFRALRVLPKSIDLSFDQSDSAKLSFELVKGAFATSLLRELGGEQAS